MNGLKVNGIMSPIDNKTVQGMTLIEVMIALVILSVGLLGLAGLQIHGLRGTSSSNSRVQAVFIISDMAERMHANPVAINTNLSYAAVTLKANACGSAPTNCDTASCSSAQLATFDKVNICHSMAANLSPGAIMTISCDATALCVPSPVPSTHTLTLTWNDVHDASLGTVPPQTVTLNILP
ncbi:MAG TPA: type IV pilus modification protein PilV [Gammaproteobacteria bacterium]|nr:type IV pilus modification protein PilV [Gammaproteobacteria bacterium]